MSGAGELDRRVAVAAGVLGAMASRDVPLAPLTTYRVGGPAALFARPVSVDDLQLVGKAVRDSGLPVLVVGRGSNLLVADAGFAGIVVSLAALAGPAEHAVGIDGDHVDACAAVLLPVLARRTVAAGLTGFEWAVGVPGSVGGAVRMNAGGHGSDMAAVLREVDVVDLLRGDEAVLPASALGLRFRGSDLADHQVVVRARLELSPLAAAAAAGRPCGDTLLDEIVHWRREHQPGGQNAGSVFVNPVPGEVAAGALIDGCGLRGLRIGTAYVSEKHANFVQATEGGTAADVREVMETVRRIVHERTGWALRSEVRLVGFDDVPAEAGPDGTGAPAGVSW